jgi:predicted dehydrogenase
MSEPLRIAVVGTGFLGTRLGNMINRASDADLVATAEVCAETRATAGEELDVPGAVRYAEYETMLDEVDLDAVLVATPHALHYDQTVTALNRGLHVFCEKPLATDLADARDLVERSESGEEVLQVGYQRHTAAPYVAARDHLESFGNVTFVTASITQDWIDDKKGTWRSDPDLSGGGQLYDTGSHVVDVVLWASGLTPTAVDASMVFWDEAERVDTQATLNVEFAENAVASIAVSGDTPQVREHLHFWGDDGAVYVEGRDWNDREVRTVDPDGAERYPPLYAEELPANKVEAFIAAVRDGTEPPATARHAYAVTAVTEAAYESARSGERVEVETL